jgi:hypothetical protein
VRVEVRQPGAEVFVDGRSIGYGPIAAEVFVDPGAHAIEARLEGFEAARERIEAAKGSAHEVKLEMRRVASSPAVVSPAATRGPAVDPATVEQPSSKNAAIIVGGAALAVVGLGVGAGFTAAWSGAAGDADALLADLVARGGSSPCSGGSFATECATLLEHNQDSDTFGNVAIAGYVLGGIAAGATLAYVLWPTQGGASQGRARVGEYPPDRRRGLDRPHERRPGRTGGLEQHHPRWRQGCRRHSG